MAKERRCYKCGGTLMQAYAEKIEGSSKDVSVLIPRIPALQCQGCGKRELPYPDFGSDMTVKMLRPDKFPAAGNKGLFRRKPVCSNCREELLTDNISAAPHEFDIKVEDYESFRCVVTAPSVKCDKCGQLQVADDSKFDQLITEAVTDALEKADMEP